MKKLLAAVVFNLLLISVSVVAQDAKLETPLTVSEAAIIKAAAEKSSRAFMSGDYNGLLDLTYAKVIELGGGRTKMLAAIEAGVKEMHDLELKIISHTIGEPQKSVRAGTQLLSIVPVTLKMESPTEFYTQKSFWMAVSQDDGRSWRFIDGSYLNPDTLKMLIPEAAGKITLPDKGSPVISPKKAG